MRSRFRTLARTLATLAFVPLVGATPVAEAGGGGGDGPAVYLKLVDAAQVSFQDATVAMSDALHRSGWTVVADFPTSAEPGTCSFRSEVLVAYPQAWATRVMAAGTHAAFAVPIRFVVWQDENGVSVGATNPANLARTIVDEETTADDWADIVTEIRTVASTAFPGGTVEEQYGQQRNKARIGRTMGIMAGGRFTDKIESVAVVPGAATDPSAVARTLAERMPDVDGTWEWGTRPVYVLDLPEYGAALVGVTGTKMESDASRIVKHGGDDARKGMACPGIDHTAAFPVELLVARDGDDIRVSLVDEMYRMKMFFEDAGKMAFAKNMGMPGSIEDEIRKKVGASLALLLAPS